MKRLHAHIGSTDAAFKQAPEVFQPVSVDMAASISFCVVNYVVNVIGSKAVVAAQSVGMHLRARLNMLANMRLKLWLADGLDYFQCYAGRLVFRSALKQSEHGGFAHNSGAIDLSFSFVHVSGLAADKSLIHFNVASELADR